MTATLTAIRNEHEALRHHLDQLKTAADLIELSAVEAVVAELEDAYLFLERHILPHAKAEEEVLYRAYDQVANSPWATDTMRRDHEEVAELTKELLAVRLKLFTDPLTLHQKHELRRILYGLHAVLSLHLRHEEQIILPRIEAAVTQEAADQMMRSMEQLEAKGHDLV